MCEKENVQTLQRCIFTKACFADGDIVNLDEHNICMFILFWIDVRLPRRAYTHALPPGRQARNDGEKMIL